MVLFESTIWANSYFWEVRPYFWKVHVESRMHDGWHAQMTIFGEFWNLVTSTIWVDPNFEPSPNGRFCRSTVIAQPGSNDPIQLPNRSKKELTKRAYSLNFKSSKKSLQMYDSLNSLVRSTGRRFLKFHGSVPVDLHSSKILTIVFGQRILSFRHRASFSPFWYSPMITSNEHPAE